MRRLWQNPQEGRQSHGIVGGGGALWDSVGPQVLEKREGAVYEDSQIPGLDIRANNTAAK